MNVFHSHPPFMPDVCHQNCDSIDELAIDTGHVMNCSGIDACVGVGYYIEVLH